MSATLIGFSTSSSWVSRIIRWFTGSKVSHCFFVYYDTDWERRMVLESTSGGYKLTPFSVYAKDTLFLVDPVYSIERGLKESISWLGACYDYGGLLGMSFVEVGRWLGRKWRNPWRCAGAMFCSEAVVRVLQGSNYPGAAELDAQSTDPQMLLEFLQSCSAKLLSTESSGAKKE